VKFEGAPSNLDIFVVMSTPAHVVVHPYLLSVAVALLTVGGLYCCYHVLREIFLFAMVRIYKAKGKALPRYAKLCAIRLLRYPFIHSSWACFFMPFGSNQECVDKLHLKLTTEAARMQHRQGDGAISD
jgi:hypothetical protein